MCKGKDEVPGQERQERVNSEGILGYTVFIPTSKTFGALVKTLKTNVGNHSNIVQKQKRAEEYFKTGKMTFARRAIWNEWLHSTNTLKEKVPQSFSLYIYLICFQMWQNKGREFLI